MSAQRARWERRGRAQRERRGRRGAGGAAPSTDSWPDHETDDVELIFLRDTPGAGDPEPNLADDKDQASGPLRLLPGLNHEKPIKNTCPMRTSYMSISTCLADLAHNF